MTLVQRLKDARKAAGLTQQGLAVAAGLSVSVVQQLEHGAIPDPRASTLYKLAKTLGTTVDALMGDGEHATAEDVDAPPAKEKKAPGGRGDQAKTKGKRS
jgi:transcriptional regulator with XRE-family HTH domain